MVTAIKRRVKVDADGSIRVQAPELRPGANAEVIVLVEEHNGSSPPKMKWSDFIGSGQGLFKDVEEIDAYINELRDEWEDRG